MLPYSALLSEMHETTISDYITILGELTQTKVKNIFLQKKYS